MAYRDERIGRNVQALRRGMSQTALAERMSALGHRWSQPTVVAVEKGERALRISEAFDLARILGLERVEHLGSDAKSNAMTVAWLELGKAEDALIAACKDYDDARVTFGRAAVGSVLAENSWPDGGANNLRRTPELVLDRARKRRTLVEPPEAYELADRLDELDRQHLDELRGKH